MGTYVRCVSSRCGYPPLSDDALGQLRGARLGISVACLLVAAFCIPAGLDPDVRAAVLGGDVDGAAGGVAAILTVAGVVLALVGITALVDLSPGAVTARIERRDARRDGR
jgi:hypothetical protein